jgi:superfamily I DNA/RNA helicase
MLDGLNEEQKNAVTQKGHVLLTACPGSGKTRVLTYKVAYELEKLTNKKRIVALTFTNRAADEIKKRIDHLDIDSGKLWAGTIHSFCLEWILNPYCCYLDELKNGFIIADEYKTEELLSNLKESFGIPGWTRLITRLQEDGSFVEKNEQLSEVLIDYHNFLKQEKLIDFDQMLYFSYKILNKLPKVAKTLNNLFHLICVDEYQDTQDLQYRILAKIINAKKDQTFIFFVGDKDQAIYGSLGGVAKTLNEIKSDFGNIEISELKLSGNYRSTQRTIDYYRNYQTANISIESKCDYAESHGEITLNSDISKDNLDEYIASIIKENLNKGIPENEICVLAPQWWLVIPMGRKLKKLLPNVNFDAIGLSPLIKSKENIWFMVARLFLVDPSPNMYFVRNRWANELIQNLDGIGLYLFHDFENRQKLLLKTINSIKSNNEDGLEFLKECFSCFLQLLNIDILNYPNLKLHWDYFFEGSKKRLENPDFDYAKDVNSFKRLFRHNSGVVVNTCHGIKGEEFNTVICFGLLHGYIPNWNEQKLDSAARKLLYVICSRAKKHLHLISERGRLTQRGREYTMTTQLNDVIFDYD